MNEKNYQVPINFNGVLTVKAESQSEADIFAFKQFSKTINEQIKHVKLSEAAIWTNENFINIGNHFFDISHDLSSEVSQVDLCIKPCTDQFGSKSLASKIRISLSEFGPTISAALPDGTFKLLAFLKIYKGDLYMFQTDSSLKRFSPTLVPNMVFTGVSRSG